MELSFEKYQGAGNDFIILDNISGIYSNLNTAQISHLCNRNFGIGADGLILIQHSKSFDFKMDYFNSDGSISSFCGNGGRCAVAFAHQKKIFKSDTTQFEAFDGVYTGSVNTEGTVALKMQEVTSIQTLNDTTAVTNTGSPHYVQLVPSVDLSDFIEQAKRIRYNADYLEKGINVNFVEQVSSGTFKIRTYERGVENETLACGTGAVAAALVMHFMGKATSQIITMEALGGTLKISFSKAGDRYFDIHLSGPAQFVFKGIFNL